MPQRSVSAKDPFEYLNDLDAAEVQQLTRNCRTPDLLRDYDDTPRPPHSAKFSAVMDGLPRVSSGVAYVDVYSTPRGISHGERRFALLCALGLVAIGAVAMVLAR